MPGCMQRLMFFKIHQSHWPAPSSRAYLPLLMILETLLQVVCQAVVVAAVCAPQDVNVRGHPAPCSANDFVRQGYNVVGLVAGMGVSNGSGGTVPAGTLLEQYTWEPYGGLVATQYFNAAGQPTTTWAHAVNRVGHQGLFFDRLDAGETDPVLAPGASGLYYNRNRFYSPSLGRFLQRDPNETGLAILTAMASNGETVDILIGGFNADGPFADGMNLYLYVVANPFNGLDPSGLSLLLEQTQTIKWQTALYTAMVGGVAGFAAVFTQNLLLGVELRMAAYDAMYAGVEMFQMGLAIESGFALGERLFALGGWVARSRAAAAAYSSARSLGFKTSAEAEAYLGTVVGGTPQVGVKTSLGPRIIDRVSGTVGHEVKVGYKKWSSQLLEQIRKDAEIWRNRLEGVTSYEWHFFRSANTGKVGADSRVLAELRKEGITPIIYE